jgi:hypothetical protein
MPQTPRFVKRLAAQRAKNRRSQETSCGALNWGPLEAWRFFSRQARSVVGIAAAFHAGQPASVGDWLWVFGGEFGGF